MPEKPTPTDVDRDAFWREVDALAQRMGSRLLEFRNLTEFAQQRGLLTRLAERHRQLRQRFEATTGPAWDAAKEDLSREHGDLLKEYVKFEEKLDKNDRMRAARAARAKPGLV
jgi:hypothetical protein